jgi:hypothetical protein
MTHGVDRGRASANRRAGPADANRQRHSSGAVLCTK